jgi:hypothetical protein
MEGQPSEENTVFYGRYESKDKKNCKNDSRSYNLKIIQTPPSFSPAWFLFVHKNNKKTRPITRPKKTKFY